MDHISIIIVNHNTNQETKDCLNTLLDCKDANYKTRIIIVDNGSKIPLSLAKSYLEKNIEVIRSEANLGFTGGNNLGLSHAIKTYNSDYFLLINNDTLVDPFFLSNLYQTIKANAKIGLVTPKIYFAKNYEYHKNTYEKTQKGRVIWFAGGIIDWRNLIAYHRGVDEVDRQQFDQISEVDFATGCCMLIKREVIESVGILDKKFFLYLEDVDFCCRAKKKGFTIIYQPQAFIWHKNASSSGGSGSHLQIYYQSRNRLLFAFKHASFKSKILAAKLWLKWLISGQQYEQRAAIDFILGKFGKQNIY